MTGADRALRSVPDGRPFSDRVIRAGAWAMAIRLTERALSLGRTVILARVLAPHDFGLMGVALLLLALVQRMSVTGFEAALIQRRESVDDLLDTVWTVEAVRGLLLAALVFAAAPLVTTFFQSPEALPILRVVAVSLAVAGLRNPAAVFFRRNLQFRPEFLLRTGTVGVDVLVSVGAALALRNVWALVLGFLGAQITNTVLSYWIHPYRPRPRFEADKARDLFRFGRWVTASGLLLYFLLNLDDIVVGRLAGLAALGLYRVAFSLSQAPTTELTHVVGEVAFPAFSELRRGGEAIVETYLTTVRLVSVITFPLATGLIVLAPGLIGLGLGASWLPMVAAFQLLALWGLIRSLLATTGPLFQAVGRPWLATSLQAGRLGLLLILIVPFVRSWGIAGAAAATLVSATVVLPVAVHLVSRVLGMSVTSFLHQLWVPALTATTAAMVVSAGGMAGLNVAASWWSLLGSSALVVLSTLVVLVIAEARGYGLRRWFIAPVVAAFGAGRGGAR